MNRNILKIIAMISMLIDHIGAYLFEGHIVFKILGRIAFPVFAFFIAEGMKYTRSRKKYVIQLFIFACISQIAYILLRDDFKLNVLFTFLIAILLIYLIEQLLKKENHTKLLKMLLIAIAAISIIIITLVFGDVLEMIDYSLLGVLMVLEFYFIRSKWKFLAASFIVVLMVLKAILFNGFKLVYMCPLVAILAIVMLLFYNNKKGRFNLKYLFYVFYPLHLFVIWLITVL